MNALAASLLAAVLAVPALLLACGGESARRGSPAGAAASPAAAGAAAAPSRAEEVPFDVLLASSTSRLAEGRREHLLRDAGAWRSFHQDVLGREGEPPAVDFAVSQVLAVDGEDGSNACHAVRIRSVRRAATGGLVVDVVRHLPPPDMACAMVVLRPACAVSVPRTEGPVTFTWRFETSVPDP